MKPASKGDSHWSSTAVTVIEMYPGLKVLPLRDHEQTAGTATYRGTFVGGAEHTMFDYLNWKSGNQDLGSIESLPLETRSGLPPTC